MKFLGVRNEQMGILISICLIVSSCQNKEEYFPVEELIEGADAYCSEAKDLQSCEAMPDICQPAFSEPATEDAEPEFAACVANPDVWMPDDVNDDDSSTEDDDVAVGDETSDDSSTDDGNEGSESSGTENGDPSAEFSDDASAPAAVEPTIEDAIQSKCEDLDAKYLWIKKEIKKEKVINVTTKVKICHATVTKSHTIMIACPALKGHSKHQNGKDYLGACVQ